MRRRSSAESTFDASAFERSLDTRLPTRWLGWRLRLLVGLALLGCLGVFWSMRMVAASPHLDATWTVGDRGQLVLTAAPQPELQSFIGRTLRAFIVGDGGEIVVDARALHRSPRWLIEESSRRQQAVLQGQLTSAFAAGRVQLSFTDGSRVEVATPIRGYTGLGLGFWPLAAFALLLYLVGSVVVLVRPQARNALFFVMTLCQSANLLLIAMDTVHGLGLPHEATSLGMAPRLALDLITAAATVHAFALHPTRLPRARWIGLATWVAAAAAWWLVAANLLPSAWWWAQGAMVALGIAAIGVITLSYRTEPNPFAAVMRRIAFVAVGTFSLVTLAVAVSVGEHGVVQTLAVIGTVVWTLFFASLLLLAPFLSRSKQVLREFAMLAGVSTVAASLDLLFAALFSLGPFASLTLAVFISLGVYAAVRQWMLNQIVGSSVLTTERTFEQLYRVAREVQDRPSRYRPLLTQLLRDLFEPLEVLRIDRLATGARVVGGGSALLVPVRGGGGADETMTEPPSLLLLRFARRGKRLFTQEDARLADRVVEQLRRAVAYDKAVERGRSEERQRIAQDLHDDIGARLLTLMYKATNPEVEEYIRHTLQDLKTLTRGLAASEHRLSHAAAEWKADLSQRLTAARVSLGWRFDFDRDVRLSVVQWSALTRVLRELVSNALYHAGATRVDVAFALMGGRLTLSIADDGRGRSPQEWSHGLGLGGVRKRVKLLGGQVQWRENGVRGIVCEVVVESFVAKE